MKKILFFCLPILIFALCFALLVFLPKSGCAETGTNGENGFSVGGMDIHLEVWQIDTFEGGTGSRRAYLEKICKKYCDEINKTDKNVRISAAVKQITVSAAEDFFKNGVYPDVVSFGAGVQVPYEHLVKLDFSTGEAGVYGGESYAAVWAQGAYAYITRKGETSVDTVIVCEQEYANPILAYKMSGENLPQNVIKLPAKEAIYEFYRRKNCAMIGTQRDVYRLENKIEIDVKSLEGYNDLYCCAAVVRCGDYGESGGENGANAKNGASEEKIENAKTQKAESLLKYIVSGEKSDPSLIGFLNYKGEAKDKSAPIGRLNGYKPEYALSVFTSRAQIETLKTQTDDYAKCEQNIKSALKRLK